MTLIDGVDAAFPPPEGSLPASTRFVAGYAGLVGSTPHVWTLAEVTAVRQAGRMFWPIIVPPQRTLGPQDGVLCVGPMLAFCQLIGHPKDQPVLIDIEHSSYVANPSGAMAAVQAFERGMAAHGYQHGIAYLPFVANQGWVARWDNKRPTTLPAGWLGDQYGGEPGYDLDVFDSSAFGPTPVLPTGQPESDDMNLTDVFHNDYLNHDETVKDALMNGSTAYNITVNIEGQVKQIMAHLGMNAPAATGHTVAAASTVELTTGVPAETTGPAPQAATREAALTLGLPLPDDGPAVGDGESVPPLEAPTPSDTAPDTSPVTD